ncbi:hypothetical protein V5P93_005974 [Actinokineospora auranticolor]|uniref:Uncharacterized protein n=1 Tax=Actinokineospora auranticolor TaxID=155976 RepID=A0A2S6GHF2_9PSEU|nr:hypothetical protein [Actinokineospora auranticolor]PPK64635.1 hypothetical protein CLV40_11825 [Actinokineospora auranticolor]
MAAATRRENIPVSPEEQGLLTALLENGNVLRDALIALTGEVGTSRAQVAHAVLAIGMETLREKAREIGYAELAQSRSAAEATAQRAEVTSRRNRAAARWAADA